MADGPCDLGSVQAGFTHGEEQKLGGLDCYVTGPSEQGAKVILMITDIYGWRLPNARLYCDKLAALGFLVVAPDFFHGDAWEAGRDMSNFMEWRNKFTQESVLEGCEAVIREARETYKPKSVGTLGFCWGGLYSTLLACGSSVITAVSAHPSFLSPEQVEGVRRPSLYQFAEEDRQMDAEKRAQVEQVLSKKAFPCKAHMYPGTSHGWTLRSDESDPKKKQAADAAFAETSAWFQQYL